MGLVYDNYYSVSGSLCMFLSSLGRNIQKYEDLYVVYTSVLLISS